MDDRSRVDLEVRALVVGVGTFAEEAEGYWSPLSFAHGHAQEIADALRDLGCASTVDVFVDPTTEELQKLLKDVVKRVDDQRPNGRIVHLLSHGFLGENRGGLYVVGSDSSGPHPLDSLDVDTWVRGVENTRDAPYTLLMLDMCYAGEAARAQTIGWNGVLPDTERRVFVMGACAPEKQAYSGRFSLAVATVLRMIHEGLLPIAREERYIPLPTFSSAISRELNRLCGASGYPQAMLTTPISVAEGADPPLIPNRRYSPDPSERVRSGLDDVLRQFLAEFDPVLDAAHYLQRAIGLGSLDRLGQVSYFTGRETELAECAHWLDDPEPMDALRVVTGSPGVGKSALLGSLVWAAHPELANVPSLENSAVVRPRRAARFAAVHARGRSLREVTNSIAKQLGFAESDPVEWTSAALIAAIEATSATEPRATVVLDALDEAAHPDDLMRLLLLELARLARPHDGAPACRVLVGTRPWPEFAPLLDAADTVCDLDAVPTARVRAEIATYLDARLRDSSGFEAAPARAALAERVALALTEPDRDPRSDGGAFLVAGLYAHHLIELGDAVDTADVPRTLGEVLELNLTQLPPDSLRRPLLVALASAKEPGLPPRLLGATAASLRSDAPPGGWAAPEISRVESMLDRISFYLRRTTGPDKTTHYRLFHQSLVDHLLDHPHEPPRSRP